MRAAARSGEAPARLPPTPPKAINPTMATIASAMVAAEQRDCRGAIFRNGDHRRLAVLVFQVRGDGADENAGGAETDNAVALREKLRQMSRGLGVGDVATAYAVRCVDFSTQCGLQPLGKWQGRGAQNEDDRPHHASAPV